MGEAGSGGGGAVGAGGGGAVGAGGGGLDLDLDIRPDLRRDAVKSEFTLCKIFG